MNAEQKAINCPNGQTATGTRPLEGKTIACGPSYRGKWVNLAGLGKRKCEDRGGAIHDGRVDIYLDSYQEALSFGKRSLTMNVL
ncbi:MAG TPA: hypothetical protein ENI23_17095 [bacterium]|nr:hypothetical protein [bacterium]